MAFDDGLAQRVRETLVEHDVVEKKMFGGLTFMLQGNMCCGIVGDDLMVRVGADGYADAMAQPHARPMDFTGKPSKSMIYVDAAGLELEEALAAWVIRGVTFAKTLPAK